MPDINIVGLGIRSVDQVTRETEHALRNSNHIFFVDTEPATQTWLESLCPQVTPLFQSGYPELGDRIEVYHHIAAEVIEAALDQAPVSLAMQGHPIVGATAPQLIYQSAKLLGLEVSVLPGISAMDSLFADLLIDPVAEGLQMYEATDLLLRRRVIQPDVPALIWQVGSVESCLYTTRPSRPERFTRLCNFLLDVYPADHQVSAIFSSSHPLVQSGRHDFSIGDLEAQSEQLHPGVTLYIPSIGRRPIADTELLSRLADIGHLRQITC